MAKNKSFYGILALVTITLLLLLQYNAPKKLNWFPSYVAKHKIPYGTKVFNDFVTELFPASQQINIPPFEFLTENPKAKGTYVFIDQKVVLEPAELMKLLEWTEEGNNLFLASNNFEKKLLDTLKLKTSGLYAGLNEDLGKIHELVNPDLKKSAGFEFTRDSYTNYFKQIDTLKTTVLGVVDHSNISKQVKTDHLNVIKIGFGDGEIVLSTFPQAFTNYFILKEDNKHYTAGLLSYIDGENSVFIDNYHKSGKAFYTSPMYLFLNNEALKWAYYLVLIGSLMYVIFEGKRKQRAIPVIKPLKNQTIAFTRTIADMYFEQKEQKQIATHKIDHFLEFIRTRFYLDTNQRETQFYNDLASRSSHTPEKIKELFLYIDNLSKKEAITDQELIQLNKAIEDFKATANGRK